MFVIYVIDRATQDWLQSLSWAATTAGLVYTVYKGVQEAREGRIQREKELRWKQAAAARELLDELFDWPDAWVALQMLERDGREFTTPQSTRIRVNSADYRAALSKRGDKIDRNEQYLRDCFDSLFYYFGLFEHYIMRGLVEYADLASPIHYYLRRLTAQLDVVIPYLEDYDFDRTQQFLARVSSERRGLRKDNGSPEPKEIARSAGK
jgi:hypothetical protein